MCCSMSPQAVIAQGGLESEHVPAREAMARLVPLYESRTLAEVCVPTSQDI